jgi:hypothetical protein
MLFSIGEMSLGELIALQIVDLYQVKKRIFVNPFLTLLHLFIYRPSDSNVSENAGIEPSTVASFALSVRHSITRLDLIHNRIGLIYILSYI